jgi:hypothetical protein
MIELNQVYTCYAGGNLVSFSIINNIEDEIVYYLNVSVWPMLIISLEKVKLSQFCKRHVGIKNSKHAQTVMKNLFNAPDDLWRKRDKSVKIA